MVNSLDGIIRRPICPHAHQHRHLRRVFDTFPKAYIGDRVAMLKVDHPHICQAKIIIESEVPNANPNEPVQSTTRSALVGAHY